MVSPLFVFAAAGAAGIENTDVLKSGYRDIGPPGAGPYYIYWPLKLGMCHAADHVAMFMFTSSHSSAHVQTTSISQQINTEISSQ